MQLTGVTQQSLSVQRYGDLSLGYAFKVSHSQQLRINSISKHMCKIFFITKGIASNIVVGWPHTSTHTATHWLPHPSGMGIGKAKMRKLVSWDLKKTVSLPGEWKRKQNKWCKGNYSPPPTSRPLPSQSPSNSHLGGQQPPPASSPTPVFVAEHDIT